MPANVERVIASLRPAVMRGYLEAGVGIEPAYTALQAAALSYKSIRYLGLTAGLPPGHRADHAVAGCRLLGWRDLASCLDLACGRDRDFSRVVVI